MYQRISIIYHMSEYKKEFVCISYCSEPITFTVPSGVCLYLLELDSLSSNVGDFFDVYVMDGREILFSGPLKRNLKRVNMLNWISKGQEIFIYFRPNSNFTTPNSKWAVFNDHIRVKALGYQTSPNVDFTDVGKYDNEFKEEWE